MSDKPMDKLKGKAEELKQKATGKDRKADEGSTEQMKEKAKDAMGRIKGRGDDARGSDER